ncbi:hypothetical protein RUM43_004935 [Polyplax serrata]|uniref:Galactokinase n=1 Tax=Polyplax serrata TaxID=468196 RepID=A0AAN8SEI7_POLSC
MMRFGIKMTNFNFDSAFFRRIIAHSPNTQKAPSVVQLTREAVEAFYDEFDYYPEIGAYAPGVFTILGDHMEYAGTCLLQAALPYGTVIVGKSLNTVKCKAATTSKQVDGLKKTVFPVTYFKNNDVQIYPHWVTFLRGVLNNYPRKDPLGFDALIHSSVPTKKGFGSSAALQVAFYSFLDACCGSKLCKSQFKRGKLCLEAEMADQQNSHKLGIWDNVTSSVSQSCSAVLINCKKNETYPVEIRDIDILFLLTYPNFDIELDDRTCVPRRNMELKLIARLLGLDHINKAAGKHLSILENMDEPSKESVIEILRGFGIEEELIFDFVDELFYFPKSMTDFVLYAGEATENYDASVSTASESKAPGEVLTNEEEEDEEEAVSHAFPTPCFQPSKPGGPRQEKPKESPLNYLDKQLIELCKGKLGDDEPPPVKVCEQINCLGGIENLSVESGMTVIGRLLRRLRHVISEKNRCNEIPEILDRCDYFEFGTKLIQSHLSLKLDYQISCPTLDNLVMLAINSDDVYGAKMMSGGGTITLLHRRALEDLIEKIKQSYPEKTFQFYSVFPSPGADILNIGVKKNPKSTLSNRYLNKDELMKKAVQNFNETYKYMPSHGAYCPGVVNFIGDHADYNHGFTMSMAVSLLTVVVGAYNGTSKVRVVTTDDVHSEPQKVIFPLPLDEDLTPGRIKWLKLIKGVISMFRETINGFDCLIESNIPNGLGISNQTVTVTAFYTFLEVLTGHKTKDLCQKAYDCMQVQQDFGNVSCGAGDPTVSVRARQDYAILLDCRSLTSTLIPFQDTSVSVVMAFTCQVATDIRRLLFSRMEDCYKVAKALGAKTLRCLGVHELQDSKTKKLSEDAIRRAKHVILENERVLRSAEAMKNNDFEYLGELMVASHNSLRYNFEVTTPELDFLVERAMEVDGVLGSKMHCGGNSSCIITLVKRWAVDDLIEYLQNTYCEKLDFYIVTPYKGCGPLGVKEYVDSLPGPQFVFEDVFPF